MSTPIKKPTRDETLAWIKSHPDATDDEIRDYAMGRPPSPERFKVGGLDLTKAAALVRGAGQTLSGGLIDEVVGGLEGAVRPDMSIGQGIRAQRDTDALLRNRGGAAFEAGEVGGAIGGSVGATRAIMSRGGALKALLERGGSGTLAGRVGASAVAGGAGAGATAFGQSEGNPIERLPETILASGIGGALSGAIPVLGATLRGVGNATHIRTPFVNAERESADLVNDALRRDGVTPDDLAALAAKDPTVPQTPLDRGMAGDNTRQLAVTAQARSNTARLTADDIIEARTEGERDRHVARLAATLNPRDKDVLTVAKELRDIRRANAEVNFPAALEKTVADVELARFFREPEVRRAYQEYRENMLTRKAAGLEADVPPDIYAVAERGGKRMVKLATLDIPVKAFHVVQQAVNDVVDNGFKNGKTMSKDRAKALRDALGRMHDKVEDAVPEYGAARKVYRDDSSAIDALEAGQGKVIKNQHGRSIPNFGRAPTPELRKWLDERRAAAKAGDDVAAAEVENYLLGAFTFMRNKLEKRAATGDWLALPATRDRIRVLMGGDAKKADEFIRALRAEKNVRASSGISKAGNSIGSADDVMTPALDVLLGGAAAATGRPYAMLASVGRLIRGEHFMSDKTANATMERLFSGAGGLEEMTKGMEALKRARAAEVKRRARNIGTTAGVSAGATGLVVN